MGLSFQSVAERIERIELMLVQLIVGSETTTRPSSPHYGRNNMVHLIEGELREIEIRRTFLPNEFCHGAGWQIVLVVAAAQLAQRGVMVTNVCTECGFPDTTALRYIAAAIDKGLLERDEDVSDRRRVWLRVSDKTLQLLIRYFGSKVEGYQRSAVPGSGTDPILRVQPISLSLHP